MIGTALGTVGRSIGHPASPPIEADVRAGVSYWEGTLSGTYGIATIVSSGTMTVSLYVDDSVLPAATASLALSDRLNAAFLPCRGKGAQVELVNYTGDNIEIVGICLDAEVLPHR